MADNDTDVTPTPDEPGNNDGGTEGAQTAGAPNSGTDTKTFTQDELDRIVKARLAEKEKTLKGKFEKDLEAKIASAREEAQKDLDKLVEDRIQARQAEEALKTARAALMEEFGLNEDQAARLQGETADDLKKDAEKVFGAFKTVQRKPPIIKAGEGNGGAQTPLDISKMTPAEVRANRSKLWNSR
jgi:hypothetical protein